MKTLFLLLLALATSIDILDPCNVTAGDMITREQAMSCMMEVRFDAMAMYATMDTIQYMMEAYAYHDAVRGSSYGDQHYEVDLNSEWQRVNGTTYEYDYEYHNDIIRTLRKLDDPGVSYVKPKAYSTFTYALPFNLAFNFSDGSVSLDVYSQDLADLYYGIYSVNATEFDGRPVKSINGTPVMEFLRNTAAEFVSGTKDPAAKINGLLNSTGHAGQSLTLRSEAYSTTPEGYFVFEFDDDLEPATQNFDYAVSVSYSWDNSSSFSEAVLNGMDAAEEDMVAALQRVRSLVDNSARRSFRRSKPLALEEEDDQGWSLTTVYDLNNSTRLSLLKNDTVSACIIKIVDFSPEDYDTFKENIDTYYEYCNGTNATRLMFDLRSTAGNNDTLAYWLFDYVSNHSSVNVNVSLGMYDFRHSELNDGLFGDCGGDSACSESLDMFSPKRWRFDNGTVATTVAWYEPGVNRTRGGVLGTYSNVVESSDGDVVEDSKAYYDRNHTLILSDGLCTGSCAVFASKLMAYGLTRTLAFGGDPDADTMVIYSSTGGDQQHSADINLYTDMINTHFGGHMKTFGFPSDQELVFPQSELYSFWAGESDLLDAFQYHPAEKKVSSDPYDDDEVVYSQAYEEWPTEAEPTPTPTPTPEPDDSGSSTTAIIIGIVIIGTVAAAAAAFFYYTKK